MDEEMLDMDLADWEDRPVDYRCMTCGKESNEFALCLYCCGPVQEVWY